MSDLFWLQLKRLDRDLINVVEEEIGMDWKPMMSAAEAAEYTRDSYYQGQDFYHGTNQFDAVEVGGNRILVIIFERTQIAIFQSEQV